MSLFQCEVCGCCENTSLTSGYLTINHDCFDWSEFPEREGKRLCSACSPRKYTDGTLVSKSGGWHNQFDRVYLPMGEFRTNKQGDLEHIKTKSIRFREFAIRIEEMT